MRVVTPGSRKNSLYIYIYTLFYTQGIKYKYQASAIPYVQNIIPYPSQPRDPDAPASSVAPRASVPSDFLARETDTAGPVRFLRVEVVDRSLPSAPPLFFHSDRISFACWFLIFLFILPSTEVIVKAYFLCLRSKLCA
jgi:hypothetical protein